MKLMKMDDEKDGKKSLKDIHDSAKKHIEHLDKNNKEIPYINSYNICTSNKYKELEIKGIKEDFKNRLNSHLIEGE